MKKSAVINEGLTPVKPPRGTLRYHLLPPLAVSLVYIVLPLPSRVLQRIDQYSFCLALMVMVCLLGLLAGFRMGRTANEKTRANDRSANLGWLAASLPAAIAGLLAARYTFISTSGILVLFSLLQPGFYLLLLCLALLHLDSLVLLTPLAYRLMLMLGCKLAQAGAQRRKPMIASCLVLALLVTAMPPSALMWRSHALHQLPPGYGFAYENGLSSTDLRPYHPDNPDNILPKIESSYHLQGTASLPRLDGAEAAYPVYAAFANACYDDLLSEGVFVPDYVEFSNTLYGYYLLLYGERDIFFGAMPSAEQRRKAEEAGVELVLTPIAQEGFVFITAPDNPVQGLTVEDIRGIYSGAITSWCSLGGSGEIVAFQRPKGSGSQTLLEYIMGDTPIMEPLQEQYIGGMLDLVSRVADYRNDRRSLGYTFRFFLNDMHRSDAPSVSMMSVNGVYPSAEAIRTGSYPFTTYLYAITVKGNERVPQAFLDWMQGPEAQQLVETIGYVPLS